MKLFHRSLTVFCLSCGLAMGSAVTLNAAGAWHQEYPAPYGGGLRGLVDRTQTDLRTASELEVNKQKQFDRYRSAQGHLSSFDRHLTRGRFDRSELNKSIEEIQHILDHNVLQASSRDALLRDVGDLRVARDRRY
ncbi:MAG: hypothetical protein WB992_00285 [Bryobacteraceae bacterium]